MAKDYTITSQQWDRVNRCPFCGNGLKSVFIIPERAGGWDDFDGDIQGFYVSCETSDNGCGGTGPVGVTIDDAIDWWNGKHIVTEVNTNEERQGSDPQDL